MSSPVFSDASIYTTEVDEEEVAEFVEPALELRAKKQELVKPPVLPTVQPPQRMAALSWQSLGECLLAIYAHIEHAQPDLVSALLY